MATTTAAAQGMRSLEVSNMRSVKWCATSLQLNEKIPPADAKIGSTALCDIAVRLGDVEFVIAFAAMLPKKEKTPKEELLEIPDVLKAMARYTTSPAEHTDPFVAEMERVKTLVKKFYVLRRVDVYLSHSVLRGALANPSTVIELRTADRFGIPSN
ncbi:MAG: hypothetical protein ACHQX1_01995 [Candidatus Micrarchaeales archaeon]